ncbi:MAG TPA: dethiobiotin synthetase [Candidatus Dormibacteraeota bacterium]|nr:dethiobiotin synthetase [Candidatus Dormibacteraeota bacterium]
MPRKYVAVCGASDATPDQLDAAREVGRLLARAGAVVINGGYGGVSGAASEGAAGEGGTVVGILRADNREGSNPHLTVSLPSGLGEARNVLIVMAAESVIAIGRGWGTLSEIALARRLDRSVYALDTWDVEGLEKVDTPDEAVRRALGD